MKFSLRTKLFIGGLCLVLVPLLTLSFYSYYKVKDAAFKTAETNSLHLAQTLSSLVKESLSNHLNLTKALALTDTIRKSITDQNRTEVSSYLKSLKQHLGNIHEVLFVTDAKGNIVADSEDGAYIKFNVSDRGYWQKAINGNPNIGEMVISKKTKEPVLPVCAPVINNSGNIIGTVATVLKTKYLINIISGTKVGNTGYAYMIDKTGTIIAHPDHSLIKKLNLTNVKGLEELGRKMLSGHAGTCAYEFRGIHKIAAFAPVGINGWVIGATQPEKEFLAIAFKIRNAVLVIALIFVILSSIGVYIYARTITVPIMTIADGLMEGADQVVVASTEVSDSSQNLAETASEQAASIEETSSALEEMSSMTKQTAENSAQALNVMKQTLKALEQSQQAMNEMKESMAEISKASDETQRIIKTIDEIAFQTNLLALNAAVEAARAGEAGAGFAVVADEVRSLAMRAAEAARNTTNLIDQTSTRIQAGSQIVEKAVTAFESMKKLTNEVGTLMEEISSASREQAQGIEQINKATSNMEKAVQQNASTAEESAAAAEELNAQASQMRQYVSQLVQLVEGASTSTAHELKHTTEGTGYTPPAVPGKKKMALKKREETSPEEVIPLDEDF